MMGTMALRQPENWLYEIWQKGYDSPCYVMVPNATDLVKSHLMIAVREEVEVLKEKISELMDKINQLEVENTILKANMPQETLQQLAITGGNTKMIAAAPGSANQSAGATPTATVANTSAAATPTSSAEPTAAAVIVNNIGSGSSSTPDSATEIPVVDEEALA